MTREGALVLVLTVAAIALRFAAAAGMDYWVDDVGTVAQAHRIDSLAAALVATNDWHPPLSFLFTKLWLALAGLTGAPGEELAVRAPFLVVGALAVPLAWLLARRLLTERLPTERDGGWALVVAFAVAVHPLLVWSDRDIRGYALLVPLALATTVFWLRALESRRARDWAGFVVFAALACWDHYNAIPYTATLLALGFLEGARRPSVIAGAAILVLFAAWLPAMREHLTTINFAKHQANVQLAVSPVALTAPCYVLFGMVLGHTVFPWNLAVVLPAGLATAWLALRGAGLREPSARRVTVLGLVLPVLTAAATSFKMPRYHVAAVPLLLVLVVRGAARTKRGRLLLAVVLAAMVFSDVELLRGREHHFLFPRHPWTEANRRVRARPAPVVAEPGAFRYGYVQDLATPIGVAPTGSSCWMIVEEKMSEAAESAERARLAALGFRLTEDEPLLRDPDNEARTRYVGRGTRRDPVRLLRFER